MVGFCLLEMVVGFCVIFELFWCCFGPIILFICLFYFIFLGSFIYFLGLMCSIKRGLQPKGKEMDKKINFGTTINTKQN